MPTNRLYLYSSPRQEHHPRRGDCFIETDLPGEGTISPGPGLFVWGKRHAPSGYLEQGESSRGGGARHALCVGERQRKIRKNYDFC